MLPYRSMAVRLSTSRSSSRVRRVLSNVPFTLTATAVNDLNAAFGIDALRTSLQIGTMTTSPTVKGTPIREPATGAVIGVALLGLAACGRCVRLSEPT